MIDVIGIDRQTGQVVLTISDHLDWSDSIAHQKILQEKLNRYLAFVESGEIMESYPDAKDRAVAFPSGFQVPPGCVRTLLPNQSRRHHSICGL